ncbi:MAG: hypothetical protein ACRBFS_14580 [Aureispira sp.]
MTTEELKGQLTKHLQEGEKITVSWDCGSDEAFAYIHIDGEQLTYDDPLGEAMDLYLIDYLELPSAGEFSLKGKGEITLEEEKLWITYASDSEYYWDEEDYKEMVKAMKAYNKEAEIPPFNADEGMTPDEEYTGSILLFLE